MDGDKEKLLVINMTRKPRAFRFGKVNELMTSELMVGLLKDFDNMIKREMRKILLFLDNTVTIQSK